MPASAEILNQFSKSSDLTDAQRREIAEAIARYLSSYQFKSYVESLTNER